jgi:hypothetical protein
MKYLLVYRVDRHTLPVGSFTIHAAGAREAIDVGLQYMEALNKSAVFCGLVKLNQKGVDALDKILEDVNDMDDELRLH